MVGVEFIDYLTKLRVNDFLGLEDFADKMSFMYSVLILLLCTTIIAVKQYLLASIACYIPTVPSGKDFDKFLQNFCWVHGTIPLLEGEHIPQNFSEWDEADKNLRISKFALYFSSQIHYISLYIYCSKMGLELQDLQCGKGGEDGDPCNLEFSLAHLST